MRHLWGLEEKFFFIHLLQPPRNMVIQMKGCLVEKCEWDAGQNVEENHGGNHAVEGLEKKLIEYSSGKKKN